MASYSALLPKKELRRRNSELVGVLMRWSKNIPQEPAQGPPNEWPSGTSLEFWFWALRRRSLIWTVLTNVKQGKMAEKGGSFSGRSFQAPPGGGVSYLNTGTLQSGLLILECFEMLGNKLYFDKHQTSVLNDTPWAPRSGSIVASGATSEHADRPHPPKCENCTNIRKR